MFVSALRPRHHCKGETFPSLPVAHAAVSNPNFSWGSGVGKVSLPRTNLSGRVKIGVKCFTKQLVDGTPECIINAIVSRPLLDGRTNLGDVTGVTGAAEDLVHLRKLDALVVLQNKNTERERVAARRRVGEQGGAG